MNYYYLEYHLNICDDDSSSFPESEQGSILKINCADLYKSSGILYSRTQIQSFL